MKPFSFKKNRILCLALLFAIGTSIFAVAFLTRRTKRTLARITQEMEDIHDLETLSSSRFRLLGYKMLKDNHYCVFIVHPDRPFFVGSGPAVIVFGPSNTVEMSLLDYGETNDLENLWGFQLPIVEVEDYGKLRESLEQERTENRK